MILILTDKKKYLNIKYFFIYTIKLIKNYFFIFYKLFFVRINSDIISKYKFFIAIYKIFFIKILFKIK